MSIFPRGVAAGHFQPLPHLSVVQIRLKVHRSRVRVCWRLGVSLQVKRRYHRTPPVRNQLKSCAFLLALQERLFDWHVEIMEELPNIRSCTSVLPRGTHLRTSFYVYVCSSNTSEEGKDNSHLTPEQAEDNTVALRLHAQCVKENMTCVWMNNIQLFLDRVLHVHAEDWGVTTHSKRLGKSTNLFINYFKIK